MTAPNRYESIQAELRAAPRRWLVTGVAGLIGSALLEKLLDLDQEVVGLDNFLTGHARNLRDVASRVEPRQLARFKFIEGDIRQLRDCASAVEGAEFVLHQAALGSVPRSIVDPIATHECNLNGFLNVLVASRDAQVRTVVYAASSSTYGDSTSLPKREDVIGRPLSPYAVTKYVNELYADVFGRCYGLASVGLRYFNVFGRRQDPEGAYAAVIPLWFASLLNNEPVYINGDGETSRDFCYVDNVVQANLLASLAPDEAKNTIYNIAVGERTTLNQLYEQIRAYVTESSPAVRNAEPVRRDFRAGDVRHSLADISRAREKLGYSPVHSVHTGLKEAAAWYLSNAKRK